MYMMDYEIIDLDDHKGTYISIGDYKFAVVS